jgi:anaerobic magnesium-protoporphyrin IX monomethyl ester cyclase
MICLVRPPAGESFRFATPSISLPLGLAYVAGALEASGREVRVVDAVAEGPEIRTRYIKGYLIGLRLEDLADRIPADADLIGITVIFTHEWPIVVRLIDLIKARRPGCRIVLGGEHITAMPEFCMLTSKADFLILGEGEGPIVDLAGALENARPLSEVASLVWRDGERVVVNRRAERRLDVDDIPRPAWHLFDVRGYNQNRFVGGMASDSLAIPVLATRGCPYQCTYCAAPNMWTPRWIARDPVKFVDEIEHYVRTYGARHFPFEDLTAIIQKEWIVAFCNEVLRRGLEITWQMPTGTRSEAIDAEVAELLGRSGMIGMTYAPESGSETTRRLVKKKMSTEKLFASIDAAVGAHLNVCVFLVIGFPHDTDEHLAENLPFIDRLKAAGVNHVAVNYYMALPGTELFHSLYDAGKLRIDHTYFRHMLQSIWLMPLKSYSDHIGRWRLMAWKLRLYWRFFAAAGKAPAHATSGLIDGRDSGHLSKVRGALATAARSGWDVAKARLKPGWMPQREERQLFARWDAIYREIRARNLATGVAVRSPADSTELHRANVVKALKRDHETSRSLPILPGAAEPQPTTFASAG